MDHQQERHEKHEQGREAKQVEERQSEKQFSKPGRTIHSLWFLTIGIVLTIAALLIWMSYFW